MTNPLFRFLERETTVTTKLLKTLKKNCLDMEELCAGKALATNDLRKLARDIYSDSIPKSWVAFTVDQTQSLSSYIKDLHKRFNQFNRLIGNPSYQKDGVWFGGLLFPEAYMTGTRQFVAQRNGWSLEELELTTVLYKDQPLDDESFLMTGMKIEGGNWGQDDVISPIADGEDIGQILPYLLMRWTKVTSKALKQDEILLPVYLNRTRKNLIMSLRVKCGPSRTLLYQKGIALIAWIP